MANKKTVKYAHSSKITVYFTFPENHQEIIIAWKKKKKKPREIITF